MCFQPVIPQTSQELSCLCRNLRVKDHLPQGSPPYSLSPFKHSSAKPGAPESLKTLLCVQAKAYCHLSVSQAKPKLLNHPRHSLPLPAPNMLESPVVNCGADGRFQTLSCCPHFVNCHTYLHHYLHLHLHQSFIIILHTILNNDKIVWSFLLI